MPAVSGASSENPAPFRRQGNCALRQGNSDPEAGVGRAERTRFARSHFDPGRNGRVHESAGTEPPPAPVSGSRCTRPSREPRFMVNGDAALERSQSNYIRNGQTDWRHGALRGARGCHQDFLSQRNKAVTSRSRAGRPRPRPSRSGRYSPTTRKKRGLASGAGGGRYSKPSAGVRTRSTTFHAARSEEDSTA